ncbi:TlpA family protein disulfide reductase [Polaribacter sp. Asnod1-A03]|uniref:TlpA family protein disulfide reductase n=1 Tax=Polaribacter sp. Asnod1-A03 TaxID=3160581 RepID=UPI003868872B
MRKLYYLFFVCFLACKSETNKKENSDLRRKPENPTVFITGTSDEKGFDDKISFHDDSLFYVGKFENLKKETLNSKLTRTLHNINSAKLLRINSFGENTFYRTAIIATPGDSVNYKLKQGKLEFFGKNEAHYNFYLEMDKDLDAWTKLYLNKYNPNFNRYKQQCDSLYNQRLTFFKNYIKQHPTVSDNFKKIVKEDLRFEYIVNLIKPRSEIQSLWTVNTQEDLMDIYERGDNGEGEFFDIKSYLNDISIQEVNKPEYVKSLNFQVSLVALLRQYFVKIRNLPYSTAALKEELTFLKENFNPIIVNIVTARLIKTYFDNGFGKDQKTHQFLKETIKNYKETVSDPNIIRVMEDIETELNTINKTLPKNLKEFVLNLSKDTVSFGATLQKKNMKVIDFWASWCIPCVEEIILSKDKRQRIASEYNVDFLYFSIDKDTQKWIDKSLDLNPFLQDSKQYKILETKKSNLIKFLNLKSSFGIAIPRYVILDENNMILDNNAPKPSKDNFEDFFK